jgi:hypothetical protein
MRSAISNDADSGSTRFQDHHFCVASYRELLQINPSDVETQADIDAAIWLSVSSGVKVLSSKQQK